MGLLELFSLFPTTAFESKTTLAHCLPKNKSQADIILEKGFDAILGDLFIKVLSDDRYGNCFKRVN